MKTAFLFLLGLIAFRNATFAQWPLKTKGFEKQQRGYFFYTNPNYVFFAPIKKQIQHISNSEFKQKNLSTAILLISEEVDFASLTDKAAEFKLRDSIYGSDVLKIIPVTLKYKINSYEMSSKQYSEGFSKIYFNLESCPTTILVKAISGIPIHIQQIKTDDL